MACHKCQRRSCFTHDVPWHSGLTCDQYDAQTASANTYACVRPFAASWALNGAAAAALGDEADANHEGRGAGAPLTRKRHILPHPAQPWHTNDWAPRTRKRHQQEHRPQRPTERSDPTQHAEGRTGDCPGPRKETTTRRNVTHGGGVAGMHYNS